MWSSEKRRAKEKEKREPWDNFFYLGTLKHVGEQQELAKQSKRDCLLI
jgi:hypothetical protein